MKMQFKVIIDVQLKQQMFEYNIYIFFLFHEPTTLK